MPPLTSQDTATTETDRRQTENIEPPARQIAALMQLSADRHFAALAAETATLLADYPQSFALLSLAVTASARLGKNGEALEYARKAVSHHPGLAAAHLNLGIVLRQNGETGEAMSALQRAAQLDDTLLAAHFHLAVLASQSGDVDRAIASLDRVIALNPNHSGAHFNRAIAFGAKAEHGAAIAAWSEVLRLKPDDAVALNNQGVHLLALQAFDQAVLALQKAVQIKPDLALAYDNLGTALSSRGDLVEAVRAFDRASSLDPRLVSSTAQKMYVMARLCDFSASPYASPETVGDEVTPFWMLSLHDSPERQLARAAHQWKLRCGAIRPLPLPARPASRPARLRVGYFSSDIHEHATMYLMSGLFREHDREKFEISVYSYGVRKDGEQRERLTSSDLKFHDIQGMSAGESASLVRSHGLDIAIDLKGYTAGTRSYLFACRLAPVQINYLGYPGTMACDAMDYIIADRVIIPPDLRLFYTEKVICLPHSYQPNDNSREPAQTATRREDFGLPSAGFVFCCFNNSFKIRPEEFGVWMRVLRKVEGSVLWLLSGNAEMENNLRKEALSRGVEPHRLVLSEYVPHGEHLARHKHADLFVGTFNYNAHTTASDALWSGVPVVTRAGRQFSARVGASLLNAIGLPELVTGSTADYERKIVQLATEPEELQRVREVLARNRLTAPLFDTVRYARNFETALEMVFDRYIAGEAPADITVPDSRT